MSADSLCSTVGRLLGGGCIVRYLGSFLAAAGGFSDNVSANFFAEWKEYLPVYKETELMK